jgi:hypothetical protein
MKTLITALTLGLLCTAVLADPCMDADVSPKGYSQSAVQADLRHLEEHGC